MKFKPLFILLIVIVFSFVLAQCGGSVPQPVSSDTAATTAALAALTEQTCSTCHTFSAVSREHGPVDFWTTTVDRMIEHGLVLGAEERQTIIDYLAQTYP